MEEEERKESNNVVAISSAFSWSRHSIRAFICNYGNDVTVAVCHFRPRLRTVVPTAHFGLTRTTTILEPGTIVAT